MSKLTTHIVQEFYVDTVGCPCNAKSNMRSKIDREKLNQLLGIKESFQRIVSCTGPTGKVRVWCECTHFYSRCHKSCEMTYPFLYLKKVTAYSNNRVHTFRCQPNIQFGVYLVNVLKVNKYNK